MRFGVFQSPKHVYKYLNGYWEREDGVRICNVFRATYCVVTNNGAIEAHGSLDFCYDYAESRC